MHRVDTEGHDNGQWRDGNPQVGQAGTIMSADWLNDMQENLCEVVEGTGIELVKGNPHQLKLAIAAMIAAAAQAARTPVGTVIRVDGPNAPAGYLKLDGGQYTRADYPDLVAFYQAQGRLIAGGNGAQFKVPDYMGRFDRAWSISAAVDPGGPRAPGSLQADELRAHAHIVYAGVGQGSTDIPAVDADGNNANRENPSSTVGGAETRPVNVAFLWCIKT
ncbi:phage tail protein [Brevundimonas sp.]|uniref:phage tail protein n=1 Tax=Brevundimonas sp. TaxID=1871086 RepID=UPI003D6D0BBA